MDEKQTLFSFVYADLKGQILSGVRPHGSKLPSAPQLCKSYDVGMRTATSVVKALREEGLIQTLARGRATVVYQNAFTCSEDTGAQTMLSRSNNVLEVYQTAELLMPDILTFCSGFFDVIELEEYENTVKWARRPTPKPGQWRAVSALLHEVLRSSGNLLFSNMYAALEMYAQVPFFTEFQQLPSQALLHQEHLGAHRILEILRFENADCRLQFMDYYRRTTQRIEAIFSFLRQKWPDVVPDNAHRFLWRADRGHSPYYLQVARALIEGIGIGIYPAGTYLPSEIALAKQFGVSADTIRKATKYLNDIGIVRTRPRKGSEVIMPDRHASRKHSNPTGLLLYLSSGQLMALAIRPAALFVFDLLDVQTLKLGFCRPNAIPLADIVDSIIEHMPLQPYKTILLELKRLLNWGFYFSICSNGKFQSNLVTRISLQAFDHLEKGERQRFADLLVECYCHILTNARVFLVENGCPEAEQIITPRFIWHK